MPPANKDDQCPLQLAPHADQLFQATHPLVSACSGGWFCPLLDALIGYRNYCNLLYKIPSSVTVETLIWGRRKISWISAFATFKLYALEKLIYLSEPQPQFP